MRPGPVGRGGPCSLGLIPGGDFRQIQFTSQLEGFVNQMEIMDLHILDPMRFRDFEWQDSIQCELAQDFALDCARVTGRITPQQALLDIINRQPEPCMEPPLVFIPHLKQLGIRQLTDKGGCQVGNFGVDNFQFDCVADFARFFIGKVGFPDQGFDNFLTIPADAVALGGGNRNSLEGAGSIKQLTRDQQLAFERSASRTLIPVGDEGACGPVMAFLHQDTFDAVLNLLDVQEDCFFLELVRQLEDDIFGEGFGTPVIFAANRLGGFENGIGYFAGDEIDNPSIPFLNASKQVARPILKGFA